MYPRLICNIQKLKHNLEYLTDLCHRQGIKIAVVTKVFCADPVIVQMIDASDADFIADSRIQNLICMKTAKPKQLLRIAMPSEVNDVVNFADFSMQSEIATIKLLADAARKLGVKHKIILMIDMGDLREGIFFNEKEQIRLAAKSIVCEDSLELAGVGMNLTCFGGILPDETNMGGLIRITNELRNEFQVPIPLISGGNSSMMTILSNSEVPNGINLLRIGEAFVLGNDTSTGLPMQELNSDCFILEAELSEVQPKPGKPIGVSGLNAFGERVEFGDCGDMIRGILSIGRQDVDPDGLTCVDSRVRILGASSDHLIVDLTDCGNEYAVGSKLRFIPSYGALLRLATSKYVDREYVE